MITDSYSIYLKARADGTVLAARYEVYEGDSYAIIGGLAMTQPWLMYSTAWDAAARLQTIALNATIDTLDAASLEEEGRLF